MANFEHDWDVDGILSPRESISGMLGVIAARTRQDSGTFWRWDGQVRMKDPFSAWAVADRGSNIPGDRSE